MRKTKKYEHINFMTSNILQDASFSEPIQKKIQLFQKMRSKLKDTVDEDHDELQKKLKALDLEILDDMVTEYEDQLENNEEVEEEEQKEPGDDDVLRHFLNKTVGLAELRKAGLQAPVSGSVTRIGGYVLERTSMFFYTYRVRESKN